MDTPAVLRRFSNPAERIAFLLLILGVCFLLVGLIGFWLDRGFYWDQLKYDIREIFLDDINYRRGWSQWSARVGLGLAVFGYAVAYHYEWTAGSIVRWTNRFAHWIRTGQ